ncbi:MAG: toxin-antitoxin system YwqK family antitoxin [Janthinobacterium lividum]
MSEPLKLETIQINSVAPLPSTDKPISGVHDLFDPETKLLRQRATYWQNQLDGPLLIYDRKGNVVRKFIFSKGKLNGLSEFYRDNNLYARLPFLKGVLQGTAIYYDHSGNRIMDIPFVLGEIEGEMIFYGNMGHVVKIMPHEKGKKQGIAKSYYASGSVSKTEPYLNNLLDGNVTQYYEDGRVCSWHLYKGGKLLEGPRIFNHKSQEVFINR